MKPLHHSPERKKVLQWALLAIASWAVFRPLTRAGKISCAPPPETVKMLTEDGRLVEVDKKLLAGGGRKISTEELQCWVKTK